MQCGIGLGPMQAAEAPWIVKSQNPAALHSHVPVIMSARRRIGFDQAQAARHAEMQDQGAGVESDQNVFRASVDAAHGAAANGGFEA